MQSYFFEQILLGFAIIVLATVSDSVGASSSPYVLDLNPTAITVNVSH